MTDRQIKFLFRVLGFILYLLRENALRKVEERSDTKALENYNSMQDEIWREHQ